MNRNVRITVVKKHLNQDLIDQYGQKGDMGACPLVEVGQTYTAVCGEQPEGFCNEAWETLSRYAFAIAHGANGFWPGWTIEPNAVVSCNDGLRPVVFLLEPTEDEAGSPI